MKNIFANQNYDKSQVMATILQLKVAKGDFLKKCCTVLFRISKQFESNIWFCASNSDHLFRPCTFCNCMIYDSWVDFISVVTFHILLNMQHNPVRKSRDPNLGELSWINPKEETTRTIAWFDYETKSIYKNRCLHYFTKPPMLVPEPWCDCSKISVMQV